MYEAPSTAITAQIIHELSPIMLVTAIRLAGRREDGEDLLQETWFSALRSIGTFQGRSSLRTWLTSIMRRRFADQCRSEQRSKQRMEAFDRESFVDASLGCSERIEMSDGCSFAMRALAQLTAQERMAVTLCDLEQLERAVASQRMRISRGNLRVVLYRARAKLASALRAQGVAMT